MGKVCNCCGNTLTKGGMHTDMYSEEYEFLAKHYKELDGEGLESELSIVKGSEAEIDQLCQSGYIEYQASADSYFLTVLGRQEFDKFSLDY